MPTSLPSAPKLPSSVSQGDWELEELNDASIFLLKLLLSRLSVAAMLLNPKAYILATFSVQWTTPLNGFGDIHPLASLLRDSYAFANIPNVGKPRLVLDSLLYPIVFLPLT